MDTARQTIWIRQVRSGIGCPHKQKVFLRCLGLTRMHKLAERPDTPQIRGLLAKVQHLVEVVNPKDLPQRTSVLPYTLRPPEVVAVKAVMTGSSGEAAEGTAAVGGSGTTPAPVAKATAKPVSKAPKAAKVAKQQHAEAGKSKAAEKTGAKKAATAKGKAVKPAKTAKK